ncbi:hypothetical protein BKA65DRAFT_559794 [Rhexocercosporidium sp. MPI-PUGE-AT-0058]|nr:hypothetical protein BKA65DRAFT_559794 [Rhexocercosporidium sp. MPI-PUGE-AT-0058]
MKKDESLSSSLRLSVQVLSIGARSAAGVLDPAQSFDTADNRGHTGPPNPAISDEKLLTVNANEVPKEEAFSSGNLPSFPATDKSECQFAPVGLDPSPQHFDQVKETSAKARPQSQEMVDFRSSSMFWKALHGKKQVLNAVPPNMYLEQYDKLWVRAPSVAVGG